MKKRGGYGNIGSGPKMSGRSIGYSVGIGAGLGLQQSFRTNKKLKKVDSNSLSNLNTPLNTSNSLNTNKNQNSSTQFMKDFGKSDNELYSFLSQLEKPKQKAESEKKEDKAGGASSSGNNGRFVESIRKEVLEEIDQETNEKKNNCFNNIQTKKVIQKKKVHGKRGKTKNAHYDGVSPSSLPKIELKKENSYLNSQFTAQKLFPNAFSEQEHTSQEPLITNKPVSNKYIKSREAKITYKNHRIINIKYRTAKTRMKADFYVESIHKPDVINVKELSNETQKAKLEESLKKMNLTELTEFLSENVVSCFSFYTGDLGPKDRRALDSFYRIFCNLQIENNFFILENTLTEDKMLILTERQNFIYGSCLPEYDYYIISVKKSLLRKKKTIFNVNRRKIFSPQNIYKVSKVKKARVEKQLEDKEKQKENEKIDERPKNTVIGPDGIEHEADVDMAQEIVSSNVDKATDSEEKTKAVEQEKLPEENLEQNENISENLNGNIFDHNNTSYLLNIKSELES